MGGFHRITATALMAPLFLAACLGAADPGPPSPMDDGKHLVVPRARRTLAAHVKAILAQTPAGPHGDRALELDELVCAGRELEWGAEGGYWDVVLSLAKAASLDVEDSWTQWIKLVPVPGKLRRARAEGSYLLGFRRESRDEGRSPLFAPVIVMPPWWELGGTRAPVLSAEPPAPPRDCVMPFEIPAGVVRLTVTWEIERYLRVSTHDLPCSAGARFQVPGSAGVVEILDVRSGHWKRSGEADQTLTTVQWKTTDVRAEGADLVLEDGSRASFLEGSGQGKRQGWTWHHTYKADRTKTKSFIVKLIHEAVTERPALAMERKDGEAPGAADLLAGSIAWTRRPAEETTVIVGAIRNDGWGMRTARIPVRPSTEHPGQEGIQDNTGWDRPILLAIPPGGDLRYRVFGLDAGDWIVWIRTGNWLDLRPVPVPGGAREGDIVIAMDRAAEIRVRGSSDNGATLRLVHDNGSRIRGDDDPFRIDLDPGEDGEWKAAGLKPGDYLLKCGRAERKVQLVEGKNEIDLR